MNRSAGEEMFEVGKNGASVTVFFFFLTLELILVGVHKDGVHSDLPNQKQQI
jgi:hypothetical protein